MSLFSWFLPKKKKKSAEHHSAPASSGLSRMDSTKPYTGERQTGANAQPANRKHERMARRELLYAVVREAMVHAGVLSSSYKFKVLSLDARGRQFLVMIDLAAGAGGDTVRLAEIEALVAQHAKARHDILVSAVYWRSNEHVAVGDPAARHGTPSRPAPLASHADPASFEASQPAELHVSPPERAAPAAPARSRFEPLHPDEMTAFKQAMAQGAAAAAVAAAAPVAAVPAAARAPAARVAPAAAPAQAHGHGHGASAKSFDGAAKHGPQSYTLLTGFEDTEMPESDVANGAALSATQYGELR